MAVYSAGLKRDLLKLCLEGCDEKLVTAFVTLERVVTEQGVRIENLEKQARERWADALDAGE